MYTISSFSTDMKRAGMLYDGTIVLRSDPLLVVPSHASLWTSHRTHLMEPSILQFNPQMYIAFLAHRFVRQHCVSTISYSYYAMSSFSKDAYVGTTSPGLQVLLSTPARCPAGYAGTVDEASARLGRCEQDTRLHFVCECVWNEES